LIGETILLSLFLMRRLTGKSQKRLIKVLMLSLTAFALAYACIGNNLMEFNTLPRGLESHIFFRVKLLYFL
jgi:hypothetical protein